MIKSNITGGGTTFLFKQRILGKFDVSYYQCDETGYIQTEKPYWLEDAYQSAITKLDIGLVQRNLNFSKSVEKLIRANFSPTSTFLDYSGGYGLFTRLMRDKGFDFWNTDKYCQNLFAEFNDLSNFPNDTDFELVTAFEVFEHLEDPINQIAEPLTYSENLLFSTELIPDNQENLKDWWYFTFETGQHVSFFTEKALFHLAEKYQRFFYTNGKNLHLFSKKKFLNDPFKVLIETPLPFIYRKMKKKLEKIQKAKEFSTANNKQATCNVDLPNLFYLDYLRIKKQLNDL
jgi:hypothetical protein